MAEKRLIDANALHKRIEMNLRASNPLTIEECCYKDALNSVDLAPTIDPESLRPVSEWELNPHRFSCEHFRCKLCHHISCLTDAFCGGCGAKMKNAGTKAEDLPLPIDEYEHKKGETDNVWTEVQL